VVSLKKKRFGREFRSDERRREKGGMISFTPLEKIRRRDGFLKGKPTSEGEIFPGFSSDREKEWRETLIRSPVR